MKYREYAYTGRWADGSLHTDTVYVAHPDPKPGMPRNDDRIVWDVQDYPSEHLAHMMDRKWAAGWLRIRRIVGRPEATVLTDGWFIRKTTEFVPNMPYDAYAEPNKVVLHDAIGGGMSGYGYKSGETAEGVRYTEQRLDAGSYDDFHMHTECDEHGRPKCVECGHPISEQCPDDCDCDQAVWPDCEECGLVYNCEIGNCKCIDKLEACAICDRDLGDGDTVWLCLDGGEVICDDHVVYDERPDELFTKVGGVRGAMLPAFAFPGGYTIVYVSRDNDPLCAECASQVEVSDPAVMADIDEEMNCQNCEHAQSEHGSELVGGTHEADVQTADVGPCGAEITWEDTYGREIMYGCSCEGYWPPLCEDCDRPIDPALRQWWANREVHQVTA